MLATFSATNSASPSAFLARIVPRSLSFPLVVAFVVMYFLALWLILVYWVWGDSGERGLPLARRKIFLFLVVFFNFPGLLLYFLLRPPLTVAEKERLKKEEELLDLELKKLRWEEGRKSM